MLLFYLKFQNRLHPPQAQACGFFISIKIKKVSALFQDRNIFQNWILCLIH
ncbi:hypothetical protein M058_06220 [Streptococcus mitis 17/34]|nr:hypothetical protein M058_06220 [Streptococcus mitis 17/34]